MNKKQKVYSCVAIVILLIGGLCCSAFAVNTTPDPERRDRIHYPTDPVASIYDFNAPGFARGIYLTSDAESIGSRYYYGKLYNSIGLWNSTYGWVDTWNYTGWTSYVYRDESEIEFRINISSDVGGDLYFFLSGYTASQLETMELYFQSRTRGNRQFFAYGSISSVIANDPHWDGTEIFYLEDGAGVAPEIPYNVLEDAIVIKVSGWSSDYDNFRIVFPGVYFPGTQYQTLLGAASDVPNWLPDKLVPLFTYFFNNQFLYYSLVVVGMIGLISVIQRWAG